ncbi:MAG TPA: hypothetical protein VKR58_07850, partial [Aquella sp.]|nr:hypothetical protein [Aquella sp.]
MIIYTLIKRELYERRQNLKWMTIFSILILFFIFQNRLYSGDMNDSGGFVRFLFVSIGAYLSGSAFWEFSSAAKTRNYLLIPAGNLEKIVAKIMFYVFGWWVLFVLVWLITGVVANVIFSAFMGYPFTLASMFSSLFSIITILLPSLPLIFLLQSLGVFASCYFKKSALFKLSVAILLIMLLIAALTVAEVSVLIKYIGLGNIGNILL